MKGIRMAKEDNTPTIWVSVGFTKNLGNYESLRLDAGARNAVDGVDDSDAWEKLWEVVDQQLQSRLIEAAEALAE
jgi:hypothetical protein